MAAKDYTTIDAGGREMRLSTVNSGRSATELVPNDAAHLIWAVNLGNIDWNPWPVRRSYLDHPDVLGIDMDLRGYPKTSGSRGIHVNVRIVPEWTFTEVRRAALAVAREIERRMPAPATSKWWKEQREGVFLDYNQNARDRTVASAYSVRLVPDAKVSTPLRWEEVADVEAEDLRLDTVPAPRPPNFARQPGEPRRVQPSRAKQGA